ncbi:anthranilate phosphoribosyltransferase [Terfezia boudieri ATCC MYA-4762]|uniref:Anthranilate phosphoribosyltransferase n=1 Tax=Terfezia boudieri ATCC MYA-4762 TaxID=1051890 RepID=A0A3N4LSL6_9PEZI|nr:anthranilate phosphoribosyltransferase [Terfezia boudieri ATCC MYA-4762]
MADIDPSCCPHCSRPSTHHSSDALTSISPLLKLLSQSPASVTPQQVNLAISHIFNNALSPVQITAFLAALHYTRLDSHPEFIAAAAQGMRDAGVKIPGLESRFPPHPREQGEEADDGRYRGGLVDIVGTGGDGHGTFNVSTTASIIATACGIQVCKHGNKASTSSSGSADILAALGADLANVTPDKVRNLFLPPPEEGAETGTFCFLFSPTFHPSMKHVAPIRKSLPYRTIFNFLGPLVNPIDYSLPQGLEARIIGVGQPRFGRIFAETLVHLGVTRAMVVCGSENLDEVSPAVFTHVWKLRQSKSSLNSSTPNVTIEEFKVHPTLTFGLPTHPLTTVAGGHSPHTNAAILRRLLKGQIPATGPSSETAILDFVILNTAALCVVAGVVPSATQKGSRWIDEEEVDEDGYAVGRKWREGVEMVRIGVQSGRAWAAWEEFVEVSKVVPGVVRKH